MMREFQEEIRRIQSVPSFRQHSGHWFADTWRRVDGGYLLTGYPVLIHPGDVYDPYTDIHGDLWALIRQAEADGVKVTFTAPSPKRTRRIVNPRTALKFHRQRLIACKVKSFFVPLKFLLETLHPTRVSA